MEFSCRAGKFLRCGVNTVLDNKGVIILKISKIFFFKINFINLPSGKSTV